MLHCCLGGQDSLLLGEGGEGALRCIIGGRTAWALGGGRGRCAVL